MNIFLASDFGINRSNKTSNSNMFIERLDVYVNQREASETWWDPKCSKCLG